MKKIILITRDEAERAWTAWMENFTTLPPRLQECLAMVSAVSENVHGTTVDNPEIFSPGECEILRRLVLNSIFAPMAAYSTVMSLEEMLDAQPIDDDASRHQFLLIQSATIFCGVMEGEIRKMIRRRFPGSDLWREAKINIGISSGLFKTEQSQRELNDMIVTAMEAESQADSNAVASR